MDSSTHMVHQHTSSTTVRYPRIQASLYRSSLQGSWSRQYLPGAQAVAASSSAPTGAESSSARRASRPLRVVAVASRAWYPVGGPGCQSCSTWRRSCSRPRVARSAPACAIAAGRRVGGRAHGVAAGFTRRIVHPIGVELDVFTERCMSSFPMVVE